MRTAIVWKVAIWMTFFLWACANFATAQDAGPLEAGIGEAGAAATDGGIVRTKSQRALDEARAALAANPPRRDAAREALQRATVADDDRVAVGEAYFRLGVLEEEDGAFDRALAAQLACMTKVPTTSFARSARNRVIWIKARSEGDFLPLARLQRVRRNPAVSSDPAEIEALARDADGFPPGRVRAEARMFVAETWLKQTDKRDDAIAELRKVVEDPSSDAMDASFARQHLIEELLAAGRIDDAASEVRAHHFEPKVEEEVHRLVRHRTLRRAAIAELLVGVGFALLATMLRARRTEWKTGTGALLRGLPRVAVAAIVALGGVSVIAAAFLLLEAMAPNLLVKFGL
jgi:hypothetical protein